MFRSQTTQTSAAGRASSSRAQRPHRRPPQRPRSCSWADDRVSSWEQVRPPRSLPARADLWLAAGLEREGMTRSIMRTLGGRPRFFGAEAAASAAAMAAGSPDAIAAACAASFSSVFLFSLPFGRPRGRLTGVAPAAAGAGAAGAADSPAPRRAHEHKRVRSREGVDGAGRV